MLLIGLLFLGLWIAGLATAHTMGGFIHVLLVLAIVAFVSRMITANRSSRLAELYASPAPSLRNQSE